MDTSSVGSIRRDITSKGAAINYSKTVEKKEINKVVPWIRIAKYDAISE